MINVMGTGSRDLVVADSETRKTVMAWCCSWLDELSSDAPVTVFSGMAEGFDECLAVAANKMGLDWVAFLPNPGFGSYYWGQHSRLQRNRFDAFRGLLRTASEVRTVSQRIYQYTDGNVRVHSNFVRNSAMLAEADVVLAYDTGSGGTGHAIRHATKLGLAIKYYPTERG